VEAWGFITNVIGLQYNTIIKLVTRAAVEQVDSEVRAVAGRAGVVRPLYVAGGLRGKVSF